MDRFVVKEPRVGAGFTPGNQIIVFSENARSGNMAPPENINSSGYGYFHNQQTAVNEIGQTPMQNMQLNSPQLGQTRMQMNSQIDQTRMQMNSYQMDQTRMQMNSHQMDQIRIQMNSHQMDQTRMQMNSHQMDQTRMQMNSHQMDQTRMQMNSPQKDQTQMQIISPQIKQNRMQMNSPQIGQAQMQMNSPQTGQIQMQMNSPQMGQTQTFPSMVHPRHNSGIDPRYLAGYGNTGTQYILTGQHTERNQPIDSFGSEYQNRSFVGVDKNKSKYVPQTAMLQPQVMTLGGLEPSTVEEMPKQHSTALTNKNSYQNQQSYQQKFPLQKPNILDLIRNDVQMQMMTRADKLKALHKTGPRAFSGPVEKVLKWHKTLQDIGILIIYEIVAKCVSVRPGENCAKNLVVRDDSGPAIQVIYYEIDFLLPELKPPCTVRVVGRMMAGTCRLQAFNVRPATGDDVAALPRRAAVAAHHVAKLCKEYGHGHA